LTLARKRDMIDSISFEINLLQKVHIFLLIMLKLESF